jgi:hypothetical protein
MNSEEFEVVEEFNQFLKDYETITSFIKHRRIFLDNMINTGQIIQNTLKRNYTTRNNKKSSSQEENCLINMLYKMMDTNEMEIILNKYLTGEYDDEFYNNNNIRFMKKIFDGAYNTAKYSCEENKMNLTKFIMTLDKTKVFERLAKLIYYSIGQLYDNYISCDNIRLIIRNNEVYSIYEIPDKYLYIDKQYKEYVKKI